jgi:hypothetical protein
MRPQVLKSRKDGEYDLTRSPECESAGANLRARKKARKAGMMADSRLRQNSL